MDTGICNADLYIFSINHMFTSVRYKVATADYLSSKVQLSLPKMLQFWIIFTVTEICEVITLSLQSLLPY